MQHLPRHIARWSARHPWKAIVGWLVAVVACVGLAAGVSTRNVDDADYRTGESGRADAVLAARGLQPPTQEFVSVHGADRPRVAQASAQLRRVLTAAPGVQVGPMQWSPRSTSTLVPVALGENTDEGLHTVTSAVAQVTTDHPDLRIETAGETSLEAEINDRVSSDLSSAEGTSLSVTLVLMLVTFGALIAAGIPVLLALSSVTATIGLMAPLSHLVPAEPTVSSIIVLIGMAVGVDYSLFYLTRARAERRCGRAPLDAVEIAAATSGHSVVVSGLAVIVCMSGLFLMRDVTFTSIATGAILVVGVAVLGSLTVLPALLVVLGRWVDRPRIPFLSRLMHRPSGRGPAVRVVDAVVRRPIAATATATVALLALAVPALSMHLQRPNLETLPSDLSSVQAFHHVQAEFPSNSASAEIVIEHAPDVDAAPAAQALVHRAVATGDWRPTESSHTSADGSVTTLVLSSTHETDVDAATGTVPALRDLVSHAEARLPGSTWLVGGDLATDHDVNDHQVSRLPWVVACVLLATAAMMALAFRSWRIAVVTGVLNLLSAMASFGLVALVFQHTWAEDLLGFTSTGALIDWIPLFMFVVLVGLSMDYHVFVLARVRELVREGLPARQAIRSGLASTAGVVTSAAVVMVSVFSLFITLSMVEMKEIGVGLACAVALDATLVRIVLLPAALALLGERAWGADVRQPRRASVPVTPQPSSQIA